MEVQMAKGLKKFKESDVNDYTNDKGKPSYHKRTSPRGVNNDEDDFRNTKNGKKSNSRRK